MCGGGSGTGGLVSQSPGPTMRKEDVEFAVVQHLEFVGENLLALCKGGMCGDVREGGGERRGRGGGGGG